MSYNVVVDFTDGSSISHPNKDGAISIAPENMFLVFELNSFATVYPDDLVTGFSGKKEVTKKSKIKGKKISWEEAEKLLKKN